jgi:hypothetical protein
MQPRSTDIGNLCSVVALDRLHNQSAS